MSVRRALDVKLDAFTMRLIPDDTVLVKEPHNRRHYTRALVGLVVCFIVWGYYAFSDSDGILRVLAGIAVGWMVGRGVLSLLLRRMSYRSGWLDGRMQMVRSLNEAMRRDMTLDEWLRGEYARDNAVLGLRLEPLPDDGHDDTH